MPIAWAVSERFCAVAAQVASANRESEVHNLHAAKGSKNVPTFRSVRTGVCVQCKGGYVQLIGGRAFDNNGMRLPMKIKDPWMV